MAAARKASFAKRAHPHREKALPANASAVFGLREKARAFVRAHGAWHTAFLVIGIVTVLTVLGALFVSAGSTPKSIYTDREVAPVHTTLFATSLSNLVAAPLDSGGTIRILNNGDEFLPALLKAIGSAKRTINFNVYIWRSGKFSDQVLEALLMAQKRNVAVRVLLDGFGSKDIGDWKFSDLKAAGARIEKFRTPQFGKLTRFHRRNHRRAIVIDGQVGFTGGMAVADSWLGNAEDATHWRDMMFEVTGPLARSLQSVFASAWVGSSGEILAGPEMYPPDSIKPPPGVERYIHLVTAPAADDHAMADFFIMSILAARESLYVATPYFIPDKHLKWALEQKAKAGVDVRLLLPGNNIDYQVVRWSAQANYEDLLNAGVRIYEYTPTFLHSKFMVVDQQWSIIGSPNLNTRSRQLDEENVYGILDTTLGEQLIQTFQADARNAEEITLDQWRRRNVFLRVLQRLAQILDKQS